MKLRWFPIALAIFVFSACSTMQIDSDYNPEYDFAKLHTFTVISPERDDANTLAQERIAKALADAMRAKGYEEVPKTKADFYVLFHTDITNKRQVVTDYRSVGLYPYYGYGMPMVVPVQREYEYTEGKIIIDTIDPDEKKIFWRAIAADALKSLDTPEERIEYIHKVIAQVTASFPAAKKSGH